jgi:tryptophan synthase beta subunit
MCLASRMNQDEVVVINVSGRGDKDLDEVVRLLGM